MSEVPILTYHSVDGSGSSVSTDPGEFERHLVYLKRSGYESLPLREGVRRLREGEPLPERAVIITFDDGYRNNLTEALPALRRHGFTATIFFATGCCGGSNSWPDQHPSIPRLPMMTWDEVRQTRDGGLEFGAHTHTHPRLTKIGLDEARREMLRSKEEIETELGERVDLFSYPYGDCNAEVRKIAGELFQASIGNRPGRLRADSDPFDIDRINACGKLFRKLPVAVSGLGSFGAYLGIKRTANRLRGLFR